MRSIQTIPHMEVLRRYFFYDQETGIIYRIRGDDDVLYGRGKAKPTSRKGTKNGCFYVRFKGQTILAHRFIVRYMTGIHPMNATIAHLNGQKRDDRWENLDVVANGRHVLPPGTTSLHQCVVPFVSPFAQVPGDY
jgi:hypothetical protein